MISRQSMEESLKNILDTRSTRELRVPLVSSSHVRVHFYLCLGLLLSFLYFRLLVSRDFRFLLSSLPCLSLLLAPLFLCPPQLLSLCL